MSDSLIGNEDFPENEENADFRKERKKDSEHMPRYRKFLQANQSGVCKAELLKKNKKTAPIEDTFYGSDLMVLKRKTGN